jgi:hypothetical protein
VHFLGKLDLHLEFLVLLINRRPVAVEIEPCLSQCDNLRMLSELFEEEKICVVGSIMWMYAYARPDGWMFFGQRDCALRSGKSVSGSDRKHSGYASCQGAFDARVSILIERFRIEVRMRIGQIHGERLTYSGA